MKLFVDKGHAIIHSMLVCCTCTIKERFWNIANIMVGAIREHLGG